MKSKKYFLMMILLCILSVKIKAQLYIKNSTTNPVSVAIGWYDNHSNYKGMVTKGWFYIEPGVTRNVGLSFTSKDDYYFWYAKGWEGNTRLLVGEDKPFTIINADLQYVKDKNPTFKWVMFNKKIEHFSSLETKTRTLILLASEKNTKSFTDEIGYEYTGYYSQSYIYTGAKCESGLLIKYH